MHPPKRLPPNRFRGKCRQCIAAFSVTYITHCVLCVLGCFIGLIVNDISQLKMLYGRAFASTPHFVFYGCPYCAFVAVRYCEPYRLSLLEEASLHPGLYKRLRAVVVGFFSYCSDGGGSVGPVPWLGHS